MLSKPDCGWVDFQLDNSKIYGLSYLDDIAFEWLDQAIHGLRTLKPFCVKGFMEPNRFLCLVSYWNCHIIIEDEEKYELNKDSIVYEYSHTSMLEFCKNLYDDIYKNFEEFVKFKSYAVDEEDDDYETYFEEKRKILENKLKELNQLIQERKVFLAIIAAFYDSEKSK